ALAAWPPPSWHCRKAGSTSYWRSLLHELSCLFSPFGGLSSPTNGDLVLDAAVAGVRLGDAQHQGVLALGFHGPGEHHCFVVNRGLHGGAIERGIGIQLLLDLALHFAGRERPLRRRPRIGRHLLRARFRPLIRKRGRSRVGRRWAALRAALLGEQRSC